MRVLITSTPGFGHVLPMAPFAQALRRAGHQVVWAVASDGVEQVRRLGIDPVAAGMTVGERTGFLSARLPEIMQLPPDIRRVSLFSGFFGLGAAPAMAAALAPIVDKFRPDLIVHEFAELGAAPLAVARGIPHATVAFSGYLAPSMLGQLLHCVSPVWESAGHAEPTPEQAWGGAYFHPFPASMGQAPGVLDGVTVASVRAPLPPASPGDAPAWIASFGERRPAVYITAGTTDVVTRQAPWSVMFDALAGLDADVLATIGPHVSLNSFGPVPRNVHVERFIPQPHVLRRASLVVSHAGAGTILGAAAFGVPQLLLPTFADGFENAAALCSTGAAVMCAATERLSPQIRAKAVEVLTDPSYANAARKLAVEISQMPTAAQHVELLESLAASTAAR